MVLRIVRHSSELINKGYNSSLSGRANVVHSTNGALRSGFIGARLNSGISRGLSPAPPMKRHARKPLGTKAFLDNDSDGSSTASGQIRRPSVASNAYMIMAIDDVVVEVFKAAEEEARRTGSHGIIHPAHLLLGALQLMDASDILLMGITGGREVTIAELRCVVSAGLVAAVYSDKQLDETERPTARFAELPRTLSHFTARLVDKAYREAIKTDSCALGLQHIMSALTIHCTSVDVHNSPLAWALSKMGLFNTSAQALVNLHQYVTQTLAVGCNTSNQYINIKCSIGIPTDLFREVAAGPGSARLTSAQMVPKFLQRLRERGQMPTAALIRACREMTAAADFDPEQQLTNTHDSGDMTSVLNPDVTTQAARPSSRHADLELAQQIGFMLTLFAILPGTGQVFASEHAAHNVSWLVQCYVFNCLHIAWQADPCSTADDKLTSGWNYVDLPLPVLQMAHMAAVYDWPLKVGSCLNVILDALLVNESTPFAHGHSEGTAMGSMCPVQIIERFRIFQDLVQPSQPDQVRSEQMHLLDCLHDPRNGNWVGDIAAASYGLLAGQATPHAWQEGVLQYSDCATNWRHQLDILSYMPKEGIQAMAAHVHASTRVGCYPGMPGTQAPSDHDLTPDDVIQHLKHIKCTNRMYLDKSIITTTPAGDIQISISKILGPQQQRQHMQHEHIKADSATLDRAVSIVLTVSPMCSHKELHDVLELSETLGLLTSCTTARFVNAASTCLKQLMGLYNISSSDDIQLRAVCTDKLRRWQQCYGDSHSHMAGAQSAVTAAAAAAATNSCVDGAQMIIGSATSQAQASDLQAWASKVMMRSGYVDEYIRAVAAACNSRSGFMHHCMLLDMPHVCVPQKGMPEAMCKEVGLADQVLTLCTVVDLGKTHITLHGLLDMLLTACHLTDMMSMTATKLPAATQDVFNTWLTAAQQRLVMLLWEQTCSPSCMSPRLRPEEVASVAYGCFMALTSMRGTTHMQLGAIPTRLLSSVADTCFSKHVHKDGDVKGAAQGSCHHDDGMASGSCASDTPDSTPVLTPIQVEIGSVRIVVDQRLEDDSYRTRSIANGLQPDVYNMMMALCAVWMPDGYAPAPALPVEDAQIIRQQLMDNPDLDYMQLADMSLMMHEKLSMHSTQSRGQHGLLAQLAVMTSDAVMRALILDQIKGGDLKPVIYKIVNMLPYMEQLQGTCMDDAHDLQDLHAVSDAWIQREALEAIQEHLARME